MRCSGCCGPERPGVTCLPITGSGAVFISGASVGAERGLNTKIHLAVDSHGMPVRILIAESTRADCKEAVHLIEGISAEILLADRGYDTNDILAYAVSAGMKPVIPPKKTRKEQRDYDKYLYKLRHLVENCFLTLKRWRGIATRYAKISDAFTAAVHVRCIAIWAAIRA